MINLSRLLYSKKFSQPYTVYRKTGTWVAGIWTEAETSVAMQGVIVPASAREIQQFPEGDRIAGMMVFYSDQPIYTTGADNTGTSDQILWDGKRYRITNVMPYKDYGHYKAYGVYMESD